MTDDNAARHQIPLAWSPGADWPTEVTPPPIRPGDHQWLVIGMAGKGKTSMSRTIAANVAFGRWEILGAPFDLKQVPPDPANPDVDGLDDARA